MNDVFGVTRLSVPLKFAGNLLTYLVVSNICGSEGLAHVGTFSGFCLFPLFLGDANVFDFENSSDVKCLVIELLV